MTTSAYGKSPLFLLDQLHRRGLVNAEIARRADVTRDQLRRLRRRSEIDAGGDDQLARRLAAVLAQIDAERAGAR